MARKNGGGYEAAGRGERFGKDARLGVNPERNREPIVPIGGWQDRLCPPHHCGEETDDADADFIRLHDAADIPASRAT